MTNKFGNIAKTITSLAWQIFIIVKDTIKGLLKGVYKIVVFVFAIFVGRKLFRGD